MSATDSMVIGIVWALMSLVSVFAFSQRNLEGRPLLAAGRRGMNRVLDPYGQAVIQLAALMPRRLNQDGCD